MDRRRGALGGTQGRTGQPRWSRSPGGSAVRCGNAADRKRRDVAGRRPCRLSDERDRRLWRRLMPKRVAVVWALALAVAASASAQTTGSTGTSAGQSTTTTQQPSSSTATAEETRPATTTF